MERIFNDLELIKVNLIKIAREPKLALGLSPIKKESNKVTPPPLS
jgi:hypothetical protein